MTSHLAVLGSPIAHSKSPAIHAAAYRVLSLDWHYGRHECTVSELEPFLNSLSDNWLGLSLTMPLKEEGFRLATTRTDIALKSGVVNTLVRDGSHWIGTNTDVGGLQLAMRHAGLNLRNTIILGAGATAVSAVLAAQGEGAERIRVHARRAEQAQELADRFDVEAGLLTDLTEVTSSPNTVISTLPGTAGRGLTLDSALTRAHLFDVAYDPWPSPLYTHWTGRGGAATPGIHMLIYQALLQVRWFVHGDPNVPLESENEVLAAMQRAAEA